MNSSHMAQSCQPKLRCFSQHLGHHVMWPLSNSELDVRDLWGCFVFWKNLSSVEFGKRCYTSIFINGPSPTFFLHDEFSLLNFCPKTLCSSMLFGSLAWNVKLHHHFENSLYFRTLIIHSMDCFKTNVRSHCFNFNFVIEWISEANNRNSDSAFFFWL